MGGMGWDGGDGKEKLNRWGEMIITEGDEDRWERRERREGYMERIRGGNGGAVDRIAVFLGEGGGRGEGQHYTPIFTIFFYVTLGS
jgi:hypothetical protein